MNAWSFSSISEVSRSAASASVRATTRVGTPQTSAARRAAFNFSTASRVGTSTLPHMPALLHRGELVLEVHTGGAGFDHRLHQLERVEHPAETGFGVGYDRLQVID